MTRVTRPVSLIWQRHTFGRCGVEAGFTSGGRQGVRWTFANRIISDWVCHIGTLTPWIEAVA